MRSLPHSLLPLLLLPAAAAAAGVPRAPSQSEPFLQHAKHGVPTPVPHHGREKRLVTYVPQTTVTVPPGAAPTANMSSMPPLRPTGTRPAMAPRRQIYRLNDTFEINDDQITRTYNWNIAAQTMAPDGFQRAVIAINGQMPGPLIEANEGDTLVINVENNLNSTTSIHWHGMAQNGTQWMDGVPGMTQCPIPVGGSFTYQFKLTQYGSFWYHSHSAVEYTDGLQGPLIIHSVDDPLKRGTDFDVEEVIMMNDWYHDQATTIVDGLLSTSGYDGTVAAPSPQSGLFNGQGVYNCSLVGDDDVVETTSTNCTQQNYPVFPIGADQLYRLRLINSGSHAQFWFSVDNHTLNVTEADGTVVTSTDTVHRVPLHNGQRYSVIVDTSSDEVGDAFWMRGEMNTNCFAYIDSTLNSTTFGIMQIAKGLNPTTVTPNTTDWTTALSTECTDLDESYLTPLVEKDAPSTVQAIGAFDSQFGTIVSAGTSYNRFLVNDTSYVNYIYQPLLETVAAGGTANSTNVATFTLPDAAYGGDIIINNLDGGLDHPYHLHGFEFFIVARGSGTLSIDDAASLSVNTTNPVRRDTVVVPGGNYAVLRVVNDLPGVWVLHCHIAWHLAQGFLGAVIARPNDVQSLTFPDTMSQLCTDNGNASVYTTEPGKRKRNVVDLQDVGVDVLGKKRLS